MAKKLFISGNYIIAEIDGVEVGQYSIPKSAYSIENNTFYINEEIGDGTLKISFEDIVNWYKEDGVTAYNLTTLLEFLRNSAEKQLEKDTGTDIYYDAWGLQKVSQNKSLIHGLFTNSVPSSLWKEKFNNIERVITNATSLNGKLILVSGATLNNKTVLETFRHPRYEPNRGLLYSISTFLPSKNAIGERRFGIFTEESGCFFQLINGVLKAVVRTTINSVVVNDEQIIDVTGIDLEKGNTYDIQMQWRGVGNIKFFINQRLVYTFSYIGTRTELTTFNPANPIAFECVNKGDNVAIECGCVDVTSEGGEVNGKTYGSIGVDNLSGQVAITGYNVPILAVRSKLTVNGKRNTRDVVALLANAYSDQKSLLRIWATRDFTAITPNNQTWRNFGDGFLEYIIYDVPDVATPMTFDTTKAQLIFGGRVGQDTTYTTTALFDGLTDIHLHSGDMFIFTMHRENGIAANVGVTFEFAQEI